MSEVIPLYKRHAAKFDAVRQRSLMERPYLELAAAHLPSPARVLDIGCGAGDPIAKFFIDRGDDVTGVDGADEMLAIARTRFPAGRWLHADMRALSLGEPFDLLIAWDSFFHLPPDDQRRMFDVFAAHAASRAIFVFTSGHIEGVAIGDLFGDALYHASLDPDEFRDLLNARGFSVLRYTEQDPDCGGHTVWVARRG